MSRPAGHPSPGRKECGYVLLGIAIGLVILGIFMAAAVPVWKHVIQREKEAELVWRGNQYVQAIDRFQRKFPGTFPPNLEVLRDQKFIRKLYKDPMAKDGEWRVIRQMSARGFPGAPAPPGSRPGQGQGPTSPSAAPPGSSFSSPGSSFGRSPLAGPGAGGIIGVASKSNEKSIRILNGKDRYDQWLFVYVPMAPQPGAPARPGAPGAGGPAATTPPVGRQQPNPRRP